MFLAGTQDARGFRQWNETNRYVKKGSKALYILVPFIKKVGKDGDDKGILCGFGCKPVFRAEDTDGEPLDYLKIESPNFPLIEKADEWGISVKSIPGNFSYYGCFSTTRREIALATKDECVFFHELAHAGHEKVGGKLKNGQDPYQEIIAELTSHCLCYLVGKSGGKYIGNAYRYIDKYAEKIQMNPYTACLKVIRDTENVLDLILSKNNNESDKTEENKKHKTKYNEPEILRDVLTCSLKGKKFRIDCGHHITWNHNFGNDIAIYNGKKLKLICSQCGY